MLVIRQAYATASARSTVKRGRARSFRRDAVMRKSSRRALLALVFVACAPAPEPVVPEELPPEPEEHEELREPEALASPATPRIAHRIARTVDDVHATPPEVGSYRVHLIDVGTGLAVLIQGHDFNLLYDGGSADDSRGISATANNSRLLAYLWEAVGPSGPKGCQPGRLSQDPGPDPERTIQTVILSHPHKDHGAMLDEVLHCYRVEHVYDSGAINDTEFYGAFIAAVSAEPGVTYHTASSPSTNKTITVWGAAHVIDGPWLQFFESEDENDKIVVGAGASFRILHADGDAHDDYNANSIVVRVDLGGTSLLLTGDAESGPRRLPTAELGDIESHLVEVHADAIDVDLFQVGHHGSETSSRRAFLDRVSPQWALIGAGPKSYAGHVLPDPSVVDALVDVLGDTQRLLRTDSAEGTSCPVADRIGEDDQRPGGCDNHILEISGACCRVCTTGQACGDSCIAGESTCNQPEGCACEGD